MRKQTSAMIIVLVAAAVTAYASPAAYADHPTASVSNAPGSSVQGCEVENKCFIPADVTVDVGGEVTWTNDDSAGHTITSGSAKSGPDGTFDSGLVFPESTFKHKFEEAGEYPYYCIVHPWMAGTVTVASEHGDEMDEMEMDEMEMDEMEMDEMEMTEMSDGAASTTGKLSDGTVVEITAEKDIPRRMVMITVSFEGAEHVNYDIMAVQAGETVLDDKDAHSHEGVGGHTTMPLLLDPDEEPLDITVSFKGYGVSDIDDSAAGDVVFTSVVPDDAMMDDMMMDDMMMDDMMMDDMMRAEMSDGAASATGMLSDGTVVNIVAEKDMQRMTMGITVSFEGAEHVNYDIMAVQAGETVLDDKDAHSHEGVGGHTTMPLLLDPDEEPLDITVSFKGYGVSDIDDSAAGDVVFTNIVPEFGTIAAMILAVAIVSIIAVTARSRLSLVPRV